VLSVLAASFVVRRVARQLPETAQGVAPISAAALVAQTHAVDAVGSEPQEVALVNVHETGT